MLKIYTCRIYYRRRWASYIYKIKNIKSRELLKECCKRGVIFTPGDIFYVDNKGEDTFRLGISRVSLEEIEKGFKIIGNSAKTYK